MKTKNDKISVQKNYTLISVTNLLYLVEFSLSRTRIESGPDPQQPLSIQTQKRIDQEQYFRHKLKTICNPWLLTAEPMAPLCGRIIKFLPELFTFIRFPNVPSTNNLAERTLRHSVVQRKIFGGTRSKRGSETKAILGSLFGTWNLQGLNPFTKCRQLLLQSSSCQRV